MCAREVDTKVGDAVRSGDWDYWEGDYQAQPCLPPGKTSGSHSDVRPISSLFGRWNRLVQQQQQQQQLPTASDKLAVLGPAVSLFCGRQPSGPVLPPFSTFILPILQTFVFPCTSLFAHKQTALTAPLT